jgi:hypothetical protein
MLCSSIFVKVALGPPQLANLDRFLSHQPPPLSIASPITDDSARFLLRREVREAFQACRSVSRALRGGL